jgi:hypothetical protein
MRVERHLNAFQMSDTDAFVMTIGELHYGLVSLGI